MKTTTRATIERKERDVFKINNNAPIKRRLMLVAASAILLCLFATSDFAQTTSTTPTDGATPLGISPGSPAGSYALSGFEIINSYNGNLDFRLPLLHIGGRGSAQMAMLLALNTKRWRVNHVHSEQTGTDTYGPSENWWMGLEVGYGPGVMHGRQTGIRPHSCPTTGTRYGYTLTRLTFTAPDGTEYELRDQQTGGQPVQITCTSAPFSRGSTFVSADGSAMTFISCSADGTQIPITDSNNPGSALLYPSGVLMFRDGTQYRIDNGLVSWMRDRNGNRISFVYGTNSNDPLTFNRVVSITDSLNRQITIQYKFSDVSPYDVCDRIIFKGFGGAQRIIRISRYMNLSQLYRPGSGFTLKTFAQLFPELNGASSTANYNPKLPASLWLPDGRRYQFFYNEYGELARVVLPTGGAIEYDMTAGSGAVNSDSLGGGDWQIYRRLVERRVYPNGGTSNAYEQRTVYSVQQSGAADSRPSWNTTATIDHYDASQSLLARDKHYFSGSGLASLFQTATEYLYPAWTEGKETRTEAYDSGGVVMLRKTDDTFAQRTNVAWWTSWANTFNLDQGSEPAMDPRMSQGITTLSDTNQVAKQTFTYDQFNNKTDTYEYDFGAGVAGALVRHTNVSYVNGAAYTAGSFGSPHLRSLPLVESVFTASEVLKSQTTYEYDNYTAEATNPKHAALIARSAITGHDSGFDTSYLTRGNITMVTRFLNVGGPSPVSYMQYDVAGNIAKGIDPRGYSTALDFSDRFGAPDGEAVSNTQAPSELGGQSTFAFSGLVTNALGHTSYTQFDYYTGKPVDGQDANGVVTTGRYDDPLDRPTQVIRDNGSNFSVSTHSQTLFSYNDSAHTITTSSDKASFGDGVLAATIIYDGLGRTIESHKSVPEGTIKTTTSYDSLGRVARSSNPFITTLDATYGYADMSYDGLGRVKRVETFDKNGASTGKVDTTYSGNATTVADQAGKVRRSITDALGRLARVDEPDINGLGVIDSPNQATTYIYDVMDDLLTVSQGSQTRTYVYDSLKRLTSATNPEQTAVTTYSYDLNSNLFSKTDPRGITTNFTYDALNRIKTKAYQNDSFNTPSVTYTYDDSNVTKSTGRMTREESSVGGAVIAGYSFGGYDALGHVLGGTENVRVNQALNSYSMSYTYDVAGEMLTETYPSGRIVSTGYDAAGRISSVTGSKTGESNKTYASSIGYAPHGAVTSMRLSDPATTNLWEHSVFNSRLQPTEIDLGTSATDASKLKLELSYGTSNNNGNVLTQRITIGTAVINQTYTYDSLNRLGAASETGGWSQTYSYDRYGNRAVSGGDIPTPALTPHSLSDFNSSTNRIVMSGAATTTYDAAGNLKQDAAGSTFNYDAENRMTSCTVGGAISSYTYDGDGHRVTKTVGGVTTAFVYNLGGQLIAEYTSGTPQGSGTSYLTTDHLGSTRVVTDASGNLKSRHDYLPFGEEIAANWSGRGSIPGYSTADSTRQRFTQKERDSESGFDYFLARYYPSAQGRFSTVDPVMASAHPSIPQSWNRYSYCLNNPLALVDPNGTQWIHKTVDGTEQYRWQEGKELDKLRKDGWQDVVYGEAGGFIFSVVDEQGCPNGQEYYLGKDGSHHYVDQAAMRALADSIVATWYPTPQEVFAENLVNSILTVAFAEFLGPLFGMSISSPAEEGTPTNLAEDSFVVRGGRNMPENFSNGSGVTLDEAGNLQNVSVNSAVGRSVQELSETIPHRQVGVTTVGAVRAAGGSIRPKPTSGNPFHCELCGIPPGEASKLFTPTQKNPNVR